MTTAEVRSRARPGGRVAWAAGLALPALTVAAGLQLLRLLVTTAVSVYRDRLGASLAGLALYGFGTVALGLLGAPLARRLGPGRALAVTAGGVALVRLAVQLVPDPLVRFLLAPAGVVLFCWFVPAWLAGGGAGLVDAFRTGGAARPTS